MNRLSTTNQAADADVDPLDLMVEPVVVRGRHACPACGTEYDGLCIDAADKDEAHPPELVDGDLTTCMECHVMCIQMDGRWQLMSDAAFEHCLSKMYPGDLYVMDQLGIKLRNRPEGWSPEKFQESSPVPLDRCPLAEA